MSDDKQTMGIQETKELFDWLTGLVGDIAKHKADDGTISTAEWMQTAFSNAPSSVKAFSGMDKIDDELKDLDEAEIAQLAGMGVMLAQKLMAVFITKESE